MFALAIMFCGMAVGFLLRATPLPGWAGRLFMPAVMCLLLCMGLAIGANDTLMRALPTLGLRALALTLASLAGALALVMALSRLMPWPGHAGGAAAEGVAEEGALDVSGSPMRSSLTILGLFSLGVAAGRLLALPAWLVSSDATIGPLYFLMAVVGLGLGSDPRLGRILRSLSPRVLVLPLANMVGTLIGAALISLVLDDTLWHCLAVGAGFAYYSLSSVLISQTAGTELGTVALMANIMREIITLLCAPMAARLLSPHAAIALGGASTMDTTLPIMVGTLGASWAFISILHAMVLDFSVPFWVLFFCSL